MKTNSEITMSSLRGGIIYPPRGINLSKQHAHTVYRPSDCVPTVPPLKVDAALATVSDLFLGSLSASAEKLKTVSRCRCELRMGGKKKKRKTQVQTRMPSDKRRYTASGDKLPLENLHQSLQ